MRPLQPDNPLIKTTAFPSRLYDQLHLCHFYFTHRPPTQTQTPPPQQQYTPAMQRAVRLLLLAAMLVAVTQVSSVGGVWEGG